MHLSVLHLTNELVPAILRFSQEVAIILCNRTRPRNIKTRSSALFAWLFPSVGFCFQEGKNIALSQPLEVLKDSIELNNANTFSIDHKDMPFCPYHKTMKE